MSGPRRGRLGLLLCGALAAVLLPLVAGCAGGAPHLEQDGAGVHRSDEQLLLDRRARAVRDHNLHGFMETVATGDPAFRRWQRTWFRNVEQLPLSRFSYRVLKGSWPQRLAPRGPGSDLPVPKVRVTLQLEGFDSGPERRVTGFAFEYRRDGLKVVADRARGGKPFPGSRPGPWDLARVEVRRGIGVLGIFDPHTVGEADRLLPVVEDGIAQVSDAVPFTWSRHVVVYLFDDPTLLDSFTSVPGGNIHHLGAMSFPVRSGGPGSGQVAMRFTLLPSSVTAGQPFLGRITRHELTHVALGTRDDGDPVWLDEGLAEYVGARPLPRSQRSIASVAVSRAREGVDSMPSSEGFNGEDQDWHYALSWMACDYIAATQGEARLWELVRAMHDHGRGTPDARQDEVLRRVLGYDSHELARRAAQRILATYG